MLVGVADVLLLELILVEDDEAVLGFDDILRGCFPANDALDGRYIRLAGYTVLCYFLEARTDHSLGLEQVKHLGRSLVPLAIYAAVILTKDGTEWKRIEWNKQAFESGCPRLDALSIAPIT